jgi:hypothetical protein
MAYKLVLPYPQKGMTFLWNVSQHVGALKTCPNRTTDVELCQFFFKELVDGGFIGSTIVGSAKAPIIQVNGVFDSVLGFWIYLEQDVPGAVKDGIISPAKGVSYGTSMWLISWLNGTYRKHFPDAFANLDKDIRLSPGLRADLVRTQP